MIVADPCCCPCRWRQSPGSAEVIECGPGRSCAWSSPRHVQQVGDFVWVGCEGRASRMVGVPVVAQRDATVSGRKLVSLRWTVADQSGHLHNSTCWLWFGLCSCRAGRLASDTADDACSCSRPGRSPMASSWPTPEHWPASWCSFVGPRGGNIWAAARDPIDTWGCCKRLVSVEKRGC